MQRAIVVACQKAEHDAMSVGELLLIATAAVLLLGTLLGWRRQREIERLREAGIYPRAGQETDADVERLLQLHRTIDAIRVYRAVHRVDLKEAKEAVEKRQQQLCLGWRRSSESR